MNKNLETKTDSRLVKFEEKLARRIGEIAILLHLAHTPEGDHAYEIRSKASDILFGRRRKGLEFINRHSIILKNLKELNIKYENKAEEFSIKQKVIEKSVEKCPVFKYNPHIQNLLYHNDKSLIEADLGYIDNIRMNLASAKKEIESMTTIWSNISGIYPAIDYLEKNGLIAFKRESSEGGRLKKIYEITELGREALHRSLMSLLDISSFIFRPRKKQPLFDEGAPLPASINPFGRLFRELAKDIPLENRKKIMKRNGKSHRRPYARMMMEHGLSLPNHHFLLQHPELIPKYLSRIEADSERNLAKEMLTNKLSTYIKNASKILEDLDDKD